MEGTASQKHWNTVLKAGPQNFNDRTAEQCGLCKVKICIYCGDHIKLVNQVTYTQYVNQHLWKLSVSEYNNETLENYHKSL